jgi:hypothetical protein
MIRKNAWVLILVIFLLISLACDATSSTNYNGKSGSASVNDSSCTTISRSGECSGTLGNLTGTFYKNFSNKNFIFGQTVNVTANVTAGSGDVRVYVLDSKGKQTSVDIKSGESGVLEGQTSVSTQEFKVFFEAVNGKVDKVTYNIKYSVK